MNKGVSLLVVGLLGVLMGCAAVTIRPEGGVKAVDLPDYQESKQYFFWGLSGEHEIDVAKICGAQGASQMQSRLEVMDVILGSITLGIYTPKTARVWCKNKGEK
jgi:hypothetical protein